MKYCGQCGTQLEDDTLVCPSCHKPVQGKQTPKTVSAPDSHQMWARVTSDSRTKWVGIGIVVLIVLIVVLNVIKGATGYEGAVKKFMRLYENYDIAGVVKMSSNTYDFRDEDYYADTYFKYAIGDDLDRFDYEVGHDYKISYEVTDAYELSARQYENILNNLRYGFTGAGDVGDMISKIVRVELDVTATHGKDSLTISKELIMTKEAGSWYVLYFDTVY